ncbi:flagellar hook protein FlgE [Sedimentibacter acidaminivorans]|jgi:flagellar hook protein FlgE|uniref:Flagellar hook protein FlgE n=1 Tax=Sedimentibacter acidaminivorans TaxID=913099 RepID=A0ABS4GDG9_9FIRM|nr:flagellar hook-basal body complex protein [Sedimentibacter acidaminivorans]MBP1925747.1 flagellar hook protein FlgE [Sedimentibacter acidaminivorans]
MMKALYSGVAGLRSHQTKMDVIGNNIANVNTSAYKAQRVNFADVYYNTSNVGYGAKVSSVDTMYSLSGYSPTDSSTDLYISGDGYFTVKDQSDNIFYTRNGAFKFEASGDLIDASGSKVLGWNSTDLSTVDSTGDPVAINIAPASTDVTYTNITINTDGTISATYNYNGTGTDAKDNTIVTLGCVAVANVPNQNGLVLSGNSYYSEGKDTGNISYYTPGKPGSGTGSLLTNALEMSNVDLAGAFTDMITTQRGFQANSKIITTVDQMLEELVNLKR